MMTLRRAAARFVACSATARLRCECLPHWSSAQAASAVKTCTVTALIHKPVESRSRAQQACKAGPARVDVEAGPQADLRLQIHECPAEAGHSVATHA